MSGAAEDEIRQDCLRSADGILESLSPLVGRTLAVTGGTGFLGTWIAESVAALNDNHGFRITLHLYGRAPQTWQERVPHLSAREDIEVRQGDVRTPMDFPSTCDFIIHAAGTPDNRVHASDALRVYQTAVFGANNVLDAATKLDGINRFLLVSSGLVSAPPSDGQGYVEEAFTVHDPNSFHLAYVDSKRASENLAAIYRSEFRLPVVIARPYTFMGPYQPLDRPWALNNFIRDALMRGEIRLQGDGLVRRSFLYGSDAAAWTLAALVKGSVGKAYNIGSGRPLPLKQAAESIADAVGPHVRISYRNLPPNQQRHNDFYPDNTRAASELTVTEAIPFEEGLVKTVHWYKARL